MRFRSLSIVLLCMSATTLVRAETAPTAPAKNTAAPPEPSTMKAKSATDRAASLPEKDQARLRKPLLELAALWDRVTRELARARELEGAADQKEHELTTLEERTERARLLIEQTEARRARALARLKELEGASAP